MNAAAAVLFAGPTLARLRRIDPGVELGAFDVRGPIRRGELDALVRSTPTAGVVAIVDGVFHLGHLAVGHAEIRAAIARGWRVWGLSSMGAIRAAEMADLGMRGFGAVYQRFRDDPEFRDDEVTLLHEPEAPYRELSEPLIHQRAALEDLVRLGGIAGDVGARIVDDLAEMWFGDRTLPLLRDRLIADGLSPARAADLLDGFDQYRLKALDLAAFIRGRPFDSMEEP